MADSRVVVCDTNLLISLILPHSRTSHLFARLNAAGYEVVVSPAILDEVRRVMFTKPRLRRWLNLSDAHLERFVEHTLPDATVLIPGNERAPGAVPADPKDDIIIAAALESGASYIVSEDRHLRDLTTYRGIRIMSLSEFEVELDRLGVPSLPTRSA